MDRVLEPGETLELVGAMGAQIEQKYQELLAVNEQLIAAQKRYIAEQEQHIAGQKQKIERLGAALLKIFDAARDKKEIDPSMAQALMDAWKILEGK
jgi:hypothetical protein